MYRIPISSEDCHITGFVHREDPQPKPAVTWYQDWWRQTISAMLAMTTGLLSASLVAQVVSIPDAFALAVLVGFGITTSMVLATFSE